MRAPRINLHIGLRIPPSDYDRFKQLCHGAGLSVSSIMKAVVYRSLRDDEFGFLFTRKAQRETLPPGH